MFLTGMVRFLRKMLLVAVAGEGGCDVGRRNLCGKS